MKQAGTGEPSRFSLGTGVGRALDQVSLLVPGKLPVLGLRVVPVDPHRVWDLTSAVQPFAARHALVVRAAHGGDLL